MPPRTSPSLPRQAAGGLGVLCDAASHFCGPVMSPATLPAPTPPDLQADPILERHEVALMLRVSVQTLRNWSKSGKFPPPFRLGRRPVWRRSAILAFLSHQGG